MKLTSKKKIASLSVALGLLGVVAITPASAATIAATRYISVSADGTVKVAPNAVRLSATVSVVAANSKDALSQTSTSAAAVRAALIAHAINVRDIATQSISVAPEYNYTQDKGSVLIGYRGSQSFVVTIRAAANAGAVVDAVVAAAGDSVQVNGVTPFVLDKTKATTAARAIAVKNAKSKALSYASLLGVKLGKVIYLSENSSPTFYGPMASMAKVDSGATVVDLGLQDVTVSISVQWGIL